MFMRHLIFAGTLSHSQKVSDTITQQGLLEPKGITAVFIRCFV